MQAIALACAAICGIMMAALVPTSVPSQPVDVSTVKVVAPAELSLQLSAFLKYRTIGAASAPRHIPADTAQDFERAMQFLEATYDAAFRSAVVNKVCTQLFGPSTCRRNSHLHSYGPPIIR